MTRSTESAVPGVRGARRGLRAAGDLIARQGVAQWLASPGVTRFLRTAGLETAVRRGQAWVAAHPTTVDGLFVSALFAVFATHLYLHPASNAFLGWVLIIGMFAPLVLRRRAPFAVFGVIAAFAFAQWCAGLLFPMIDPALLIAMYSVAAYAPIRKTLAAFAVMELGVVLAVIRWAYENGELRVFTFLSGMVTAAAVLGVNKRTRRAYLASLEERARRLEFERDQQAQIAAAAERASIAREVHDVVTHSLSVMVALTDGASYAMHTSPERAAEAVEKASEVGRQAIADMQRVLGVLRAGREGAEPALQPQPGLTQLDSLLSEVRAAGLPVELVVSGAAPELSSGVELAVYRVVQEALTNTRKHAEPGASARVTLRFGDEAVDVTVVDDGSFGSTNSARQASSTTHVAVGSGGHGIAGMKERVAAFGGDLEAGPLTAARGWRVHARVPVGGAAA